MIKCKFNLPILFVLLAFVACTQTNISKKTSIESKNMTQNTNIDPTSYIGKTVQELLNGVGQPYLEYVFFDQKPGLLAGANFKFSGEKWLRVQVSKYQHLTPFNTARNWDIAAFKQEIITKATWE